MPTTTDFRIALFPGDGIGPEVSRPCLALVQEAVARVGGFSLTFEELPAGAACYRDTGTALPAAALRAAGRSDAILLAAMGLPSVRYPDGTEIAPQLDLRFEFGLYAGVRPARALPGLPLPLADPRARDIDLVLVRESTEGLFAARGNGIVEDDAVARDTMVISRGVCERLFDFSFALGRRRKAAGRQGIVTCVDKANVFTSLAFFRKIFDERAAGHGDVGAEHAYVDAMALNLVRQPWAFDVIVTENMFGDILSDLCAGLVGGMGLAPSGDIGDDHAVFQPCHGSAPDIAGQGRANPTAMILSAAMMLDWLAERHGVTASAQAASLLTGAVETAYAGGLLPCELGGTAGTAEIAAAVSAALDAASAHAPAPSR